MEGRDGLHRYKREGSLLSKRYGRQKRRKDKQEISKLTGRVSTLGVLLANKNRNIKTARSIIELVEKISPNSIFFEPSRINSGVSRWSLETGPKEGTPTLRGDILFDATYKLEYVDLHKLEFELVDKGFNRMLHFETYIDGMAEATYTISREGLENMPVEYISKKIARQLILSFKNKGKYYG